MICALADLEKKYFWIYGLTIPFFFKKILFCNYYSMAKAMNSFWLQEFSLQSMDVHPIRRSVAMMIILSYQPMACIQRVIDVFILCMLVRAHASSSSSSSTYSERLEVKGGEVEDEESSDDEIESVSSAVPDDGVRLRMNKLSAAVRALRALRIWMQSCNTVRLALFSKDGSAKEYEDESRRLSNSALSRCVVMSLKYYSVQDEKTSRIQDLTERDYGEKGACSLMLLYVYMFN